MAHTYTDTAGSQLTGVRFKLETLLEACEPSFDEGELLEEIRTLTETCGGEMLFELPAIQGGDQPAHWAVLRFTDDDGERFVHVFFGGGQDGHRVAIDDEVPEHLSSFAHTWVDVLTRWAIDSGAAKAASAPL